MNETPAPRLWAIADRASKIASLFCQFVAIIGLCAMAAITIWQVIARYILNAPPSWSEQLCLLLMLYSILFAVAAGVREGFHIRVSLLEENLSGRAGQVIRIFNHVIVGGFGLLMCAAGVKLIGVTSEHVIPTLGLPRSVSYLPIMMCGALIFLFTIEHIFNLVRGSEVTPIWS